MPPVPDPNMGISQITEGITPRVTTNNSKASKNYLAAGTAFHQMSTLDK